VNGYKLDDFNRQTWVAYSDLCGTKAKYDKDPEEAARSLGRFYNTVYELHQQGRQMSALVVSDCAIFWLNDHCGGRGGADISHDALPVLLERLKELHRRMVKEDLLLRTTVAYGHFCYQQRLESHGLGKGFIVGRAYIDAYLANDSVRKGAIILLGPPESKDWHACAGTNERFLCRSQGAKMREFVWWVDAASQVTQARRQIKEAEKAEIRALLAAYGGQCCDR
jgi:hypothetical protein